MLCCYSLYSFCRLLPALSICSVDVCWSTCWLLPLLVVLNNGCTVQTSGTGNPMVDLKLLALLYNRTAGFCDTENPAVNPSGTAGVRCCQFRGASCSSRGRFVTMCKFYLQLASSNQSSSFFAEIVYFLIFSPVCTVGILVPVISLKCKGKRRNDLFLTKFFTN